MPSGQGAEQAGAELCLLPLFQPGDLVQLGTRLRIRQGQSVEGKIVNQDTGVQGILESFFLAPLLQQFEAGAGTPPDLRNASRCQG